MSLIYPKNRRNVFHGDVEVIFNNVSDKDLEVRLIDESYNNGITSLKIRKGKSKVLMVDLSKSHNWYDFKIVVDDYSDCEWHYAGHVAVSYTHLDVYKRQIIANVSCYAI